MARGACPAVRTLQTCLMNSIPFLKGNYKEPGGKISPRLQMTGNPRHQMGVCLDIILFAMNWNMYDKNVNWNKEKILGENLVKSFIDLRAEMKWTEIIYQDRLFWEPEYYKKYGADKKHFTHIHIDWMTNSLKGKGKSEEEIINNSPQTNHTDFSAPLLAKLNHLNLQWNDDRLFGINLASINKTYSPDFSPLGDWQIKVADWVWIYTFTADGNVTWRDPSNNQTGKGTWSISFNTISFSWFKSKTVETWSLPLNPFGQTGKVIMKGKNYVLNAIRL